MTSTVARAAEGPAIGSFTFDDAAVEFAIDALDRMGIHPVFMSWRDGERERLGRHTGGAPKLLSDEAVLVAALPGSA